MSIMRFEVAPQPGSAPPRNSEELLTPQASKNLPPRDYFLIPLLSLLTVIVMLSAAEIASRLVWTSSGQDGCLKFDPLTGPRGVPNCTFQMKLPESSLVTYRFNDCGYRTLESCAPKPARTIRIALMGSSISEGYLNPYQQTFSQETAKALTHICRRSVQFQNMGIEGCSPTDASLRMDEALAMQPDAIVYAFNAYDLEHNSRRDLPKPQNALAAPQRASAGTNIKLLLANIRDAAEDSRALLVAQHFLLQDPQLYLDLYLRQGEHAGYLQISFPPAWERYFAQFAENIATMAQKSHESHIPLILVPIPERAQAALFALKNHPPGIDPFAFERRVAQIARADRLDMIDLFHDFSREPHPEKLFYVVQTHLTPGGNAVISRALTRELLKLQAAGFASCSAQ